MTISRLCLAVLVSCLIVAQAIVVEAQILDSALPDSPEGVQSAVGSSEAEDEDGGILPTSWPSIPLPTVTMPKLSMPKWPTNPDGTAVSPFAPISTGASKVSAGAKQAWKGTKEMFTFGGTEEASQPRVPAATQSQPTLWQRMTGQQPEPTGPQTVAEWMSQPRLNP